MNATRRIPVVCQTLTIGQREVRRFVGLITHRVLWETAQTDTRCASNPRGYQRELEPRRCRALAAYYQKGGQTADGITLNVRASEQGRARLQFVREGDSVFGYLELGDNARPFWVIDGQHRIFSFEYFQTSELVYPVTIYEGLTKNMETMLFVYINDRQKRMKTDLALALLADLKRAGEGRAPWKQRAVEIVRRLDTDTDSPWHGQINETGARGSKRAVNLASFVTSLKRMLDPISPFADLPQERQVAVLKLYWSAVSDVFPKAWEMGQAKKNHLLTKTLGVYVMHLLAAEHVFKSIDLGANRLSSREFAAVLRPLEGTDWWSTRTGEFRAMNSMKGFQEAARSLRKELVGDTATDEGELWDALEAEAATDF